MVISDFTAAEIDFLLERCNFTDIEKQLFVLRAKNKSLVEIATTLNMSVDGIKKISRKVNKKIIRSI